MEGVPAVIMGIVVLFFLTDRPEQAKWLKDDERAWLMTAMAREKPAGPQPNLWQALRLGLFDGRVLVLALIYFGTSAGLYVLGLWSPLIISDLGLTTMQVGWVNALPGFVAVIAMILWSAHSDKSGERVWHVVGACLLAAAGLFYAGVATGLLGLVAALIIVNIGVSASKPPLWSLSTLFLSGPAAAVGIANINALGNLGGFVGPYMVGWIKDWTGSYLGGLYFTGGLLLISAIGTLLLARSQSLAIRPQEN
jgi:MFS transporter, ACS family, tartrate transporter